MTALTLDQLAAHHDLTPLTATTTCSDPQAAYQGLRDRWGHVAPVELEPGIPAWLLLGYHEICQAARDERLFSRDPNNWRLYAQGSVPPDSNLGPMMFPRDNAYFSDGDRHRRLRAPLDDGLERIDRQRLGHRIRAACAEQISLFAGRGEADLVGDYAAVVPMLSVCGFFGISTDQGRELRDGLIALFGSGEDSQEGNRAFERILSRAMQDHRERPAADLTTAFLEHPNLTNDFEIVQSIVLMISAGYETTTSWIAQALRLMLTDRRFAGDLRGGRLGIDDALDEVLWRDPPMANMPARYALADCEIAGRPIQQGDALILGFGAANNDPRIRPESGWHESGNRSHLAWSVGPHTCPASRQARVITRIAVDTALNELQDVALAVDESEIGLTPSPWTRCPASLPVRFTPHRS
ncbi:cytochrome P450 [Saccharopolyspora rosea]|uniref:Cytochrome P450 n=1 Tax=Saccharopolyspora rosea TaxID=524884 RepID=A0ABW3FS85_9PSEU|nr:cytochrome P450 [Saccharopolyspora rosea]